VCGLSTAAEHADMFDIACDVMCWSPLIEYNGAQLSESATSLVSACKVSGVNEVLLPSNAGVLALSVVEMINMPSLNLCQRHRRQRGGERD
jgi:hypothetical protein